MHVSRIVQGTQIEDQNCFIMAFCTRATLVLCLRPHDGPEKLMSHSHFGGTREGFPEGGSSYHRSPRERWKTNPSGTTTYPSEIRESSCGCQCVGG